MPVATDQLEMLGSNLSNPPTADMATRERFRIDGVTPAAVVEPIDAGEVAEVIRWARASSAALLPATTGLYLPLGNPPAASDIALSLARLNRVLYYDAADLTLGVEPGIPLAQVQEMLSKDGLFLPVDPPYADHPQGAAVGGLVAANASGSKPAAGW
jgi:FAD/FMN-containing dehydrogenase